MSQKNRVIWVIGASSGIGFDLSAQLADDGANIIVSSRRKDKLEELAATLNQHGEHMVATCDISNPVQIRECLNEIIAHYHRLDAVVVMAGTWSPANIRDMDLTEARNIIDINLKGPINVLHYVLPQFEKQHGGHVVFCASVAGYIGLPGGQPYSATKAGLINLAQSLKSEYADFPIKVQVINPGFVKTPMTDKNDFDMPMAISSEKAASAIVKGMNGSGFEIHFPRCFTFIMKCLALLPYRFFFSVTKHLAKERS